MHLFFFSFQAVSTTSHKEPVRENEKKSIQFQYVYTFPCLEGNWCLVNNWREETGYGQIK